MHKTWIIFPTIVFLYEMLPVSIPGPFDDFFAFGGSCANDFFQFLAANHMKQDVMLNQEKAQVKQIDESKNGCINSITKSD